MLASACRFRVIFVALVLGLSLSGCSKLKFAYQQLDWTIPLYASRYISLDKEQKEQFKAALNRFLQWHCTTQVPAYVEVFKQWQVQAAAPRISNQQLDNYYDAVMGFWRAMVEQSVVELSPLLPSLKPSQVDELFANLENKNRDFEKDYVSAGRDDVAEELYDHMVDRLENWVDDLNRGQKAWIKRWSQESVDDQSARLQVRKNWQTRLRQSWRERKDDAGFQAEFRSLMTQPEQTWPDHYADVRKRQRQALLNLLQNVINSLEPKQRHYLQKRLGYWIYDLESLHCLQG